MSNRPVVLFVDDEPNILNGLKRYTRTKRKEWDIYFAASGEEALDHFKTQNVDALITDMRMPGMDGADLIERVSLLNPATIKFVLSGEADVDQSARTIGKTHRFLAKPCDPASIVEMISIILAQRSKTYDDQAIQMSEIFEEIPVRQRTLDNLQEAVGHSEPSQKRVHEIVSQDENLSVKLLQIVNSAYLGRAVPTFSINRSIDVIGVKRVLELAKGDSFGKTTTREELNVRVLELAREAKTQMARRGGSAPMQSLAFAAGLFSELGEDEAIAGAGYQHRFFKSPRAEYICRLFGLPDALSSLLASLRVSEASSASIEQWAQIICDQIEVRDRQIA